MQNKLRNGRGFGLLSLLCLFAILTGPAVPAASAQSASTASAAKSRLASAKPLRLVLASTTKRHTTRRHAEQKAVAPQPSEERYFVEFRARTAQSYGHAFVVHGLVTENNKILPSQVAGLHPAGNSAATYILGHILPVPAETGASYGDTDERYLTASYRIEMGKAKYLKIAAFIKKLQTSKRLWTATMYNCNAFVADIAHFMGLRTPSILEYPKNFVDQIREMNK